MNYKKITITNLEIRRKQDKNGNEYFIIIDKDKEVDNGYFCFRGKVESGYDELVNKLGKIKEIELEYEINELGKNTVKSIGSSSFDLKLI